MRVGDRGSMAARGGGWVTGGGHCDPWRRVGDRGGGDGPWRMVGDRGPAVHGGGWVTGGWLSVEEGG